jgi:hypothetical protein
MALVILDLVLAAGLTYKALERKDVLLLPTVQREQVLVPDQPSDHSLAAFAMLAVNAFENFSYHTAAAQRNYLLALVGPKFASELDHATRDRVAVAQESKMSSQFAIDPTSPTVRRLSDDLYEVRLFGTKQVVIADRVSWSDGYEYRVAISPGAPSRWNPYGLYVSGFVARKQDRAKKELK